MRRAASKIISDAPPKKVEKIHAIAIKTIVLIAVPITANVPVVSVREEIRRAVLILYLILAKYTYVLYLWMDLCKINSYYTAHLYWTN